MKTLVITLPRSASENFCKLYAQQHQLAYVDEVWNPRRFPESNVSGEQFLQQQIDFWSNCKNSIGKLFAFDVIAQLNCDEQTSIEYFKRIAQHADNVIYLYRRDTTKQVISTLISERTDLWGKTRAIPEQINIRNGAFEECSLHVLRNHKRVLELREHIPGEVVCAEDYLHNSEYRKYPHQYSNPGNYVYNLENIEQLYEQG